jgi:hypothetical protein
MSDRGFTRNTQAGLKQMREYEAGQPAVVAPAGNPAKGQVNLDPNATVLHPLQDGKKMTPEQAKKLAQALRNRNLP